MDFKRLPTLSRFLVRKEFAEDRSGVPRSCIQSDARSDFRTTTLHGNVDARRRSTRRQGVARPHATLPIFFFPTSSDFFSIGRGGLSFSRLKFRYTRLLHSSFRFGEKSTVREMWRVGERKSRYMERIARRQLPRGFASPVLRSTIERATETLKSDRDRDREKERSQPTPDH